MTATRTQLRGGKPAPYEDEVSVAPPGLVFDLPEGFTMCDLCNRLGKLGFRHTFEIQRFARDLSLVVSITVRTAAAASKPNIIVILADDLGYGDTSAYGSKIIRTPNIDALAASGVRFTDGHVNHPVCAPSRAGLLTGRYQERFGKSAAEDSLGQQLLSGQI